MFRAAALGAVLIRNTDDFWGQVLTKQLSYGTVRAGRKIVLSGAVMRLLSVFPFLFLACHPQAATSPVTRADTSQVSAVCVANLEGISEGPVSPIADDAKQVCSLLGAPFQTYAYALSKEDVLTRLRRAPAAHVRALFYAGHGEWMPGLAGSVDFVTTTPTSSDPLTALDLIEAMGGERADSTDISILILNTCDSGYVDLRTLTHRMSHQGMLLSVLGSGYGSVDARQAEELPNTKFGGALASALAGDADGSPIGNCDGVLTDQEVADYVNYQLNRGTRTSWDDFKLQPYAVLKRNVEFPLPIKKMAPRTQCNLPTFEKALRTLPAALRSSAREYRNLLHGLTTRPTKQRKFLLVAPTVDRELHETRAAVMQQLKPLSQRLGWEMVDTSDIDTSHLAGAAKEMSFLDILLLRILPSALGGIFVELTSLSSATTVWGDIYHPTPKWPRPVDIAHAVARRLPRPYTLFRFGDAGDSTILLRIEGQIPDRLTPVRWNQFLLPLTNPDAKTVNISANVNTIELKSLLPAPCPGGVGQCFQAGSLKIANEFDQWLLLSPASEHRQ